MSTHRIYWNAPYQKEFDAKVIEIKDSEFGKVVVLDQTCFYAMSGGQTGDSGTLNGERVRDTRYEDNKKQVIYHYLEAEETELKVGDEVHGEIDWDRRYKIMRLHSLVHIMGILFEKEYPGNTVIGSNVNEKKGRADWEFFEDIDIEKLQNQTQEAIDTKADVTTKGSSEDEERRIWDMAGFGTMPCGGTHVKNSSEIGKIRLKRKSLGKQGQRVYCMLED